jgi:hypothetical protein
MFTLMAEVFGEDSEPLGAQTTDDSMPVVGVLHLRSGGASGSPETRTFIA